MLQGVTIGDKHSYSDFNLLMKSKVISQPEVQSKFLTVPMRDGDIDLTEVLTDSVKYGNRTITIKFKLMEKFEDIWTKISEVENYLHGKRMKVVFDDDIAYYYIGRLSVNNPSVNKSTGEFEITGNMEPYKLDASLEDGEWLWDTFDFEEGFISDMKFDVDGTYEALVKGMDKETYPTIAVSSDMTVLYGDSTFTLKAGKNVLYDMILASGINTLTFKGNGSVEISYTGGIL